jgi:hypothetical protein
MLVGTSNEYMESFLSSIFTCYSLLVVDARILESGTSHALTYFRDAARSASVTILAAQLNRGYVSETSPISASTSSRRQRGIAPARRGVPTVPPSAGTLRNRSAQARVMPHDSTRPVAAEHVA